jgi:hypothetical protein
MRRKRIESVVGAGSPGGGLPVLRRVRVLIWNWVSRLERRDEENLLSEVRSVESMIVSGRGCVVRVKDVGCWLFC